MEVRMFCARFKKGSKQFRKIFYEEKSTMLQRVSNRCLTNFENITATSNLSVLEKINGNLAVWNIHFLPNRMRDFFKNISITYWVSMLGLLSLMQMSMTAVPFAV
jgi:uncharacterized protein (DUF488 family)